MTVDWRAVRRLPTSEIIRDRLIPVDAGAVLLWTAEAGVHLLTAYGALAWDGRSDKPAGSDYEWAGANLLCNAGRLSSAARVTPLALMIERWKARADGR